MHVDVRDVALPAHAPANQMRTSQVLFIKRPTVCCRKLHDLGKRGARLETVIERLPQICNQARVTSQRCEKIGCSLDGHKSNLSAVVA